MLGAYMSMVGTDIEVITFRTKNYSEQAMYEHKPGPQTAMYDAE